MGQEISMPDLTSYIKNLQKQGYSLQSIKETLLKYNYPEASIDKAIYNIRKPKVPIKFLIVIFLILLVVGIVIAFILYWPETQADLTVEITALPNEAQPGSTLPLTVTLSGSSSDVYLKAEILSKNERVALKSENFPLKPRHTMQISIPENVNPGQYTLKVSARQAGLLQEARKTFIVPGAKETCSDGIRNQNEIRTDCGGVCRPCQDTQEEEEEETEIVIDKPINTINVWDELDRIKALAETYPERAEKECADLQGTFRNKCYQNVGEIAKDAQTCDKISDDSGSDKSYTRDRCFSNVAKAVKKKLICENIQKESRKDNCYISFAIDGDYTVCDKIVNSYLKKSCNTLKGSN